MLVPLLLLGAVELALRLGGYGYSTEFFKKTTLAGKEYFVENDQFGLRFFPAALARVASPELMPANKAPHTIRIFILGESAALGDPRPNYGAGRYLETLLRARFPEQTFEVVNTGITAINSHVILPIARECARHEGDVWIVYMGNNEMVGPFGAATVFGAQAPPLRLVRLNLWLQETRVGQLLGALVSQLRHRSGVPAEWRGMEMFRGNQVPPNDPRKEVVYQNFAQNLDDLLRAGCASGAAIVLNTVAVNLKDCPPFSSAAPTNLPPTQAAAFQKLCQEADAARDSGDYDSAADSVRDGGRDLPAIGRATVSARRMLAALDQPRGRGTPFSTVRGCGCAAVSGRFTYKRAADRRWEKVCRPELGVVRRRRGPGGRRARWDARGGVVLRARAPEFQRELSARAGVGRANSTSTGGASHARRGHQLVAADAM